MIYYVCDPGHAYTQAVVLLYFGKTLRPLFRLVAYEKAELLRRAGPGTVIWTDFDRLGPAELAVAGALRAELQAARRDLTHLNDPLASEQRFALLSRLHAEGRNSFAVRRPDGDLEGLRYPVFLRDEVGAAFAAPALLPDRQALAAAIAALPAEQRGRPMIVEFGAEPGADGYYRKYGAYRVGERIYPQHCLVHPHWFVKHTGPLAPAHRAEHAAYLETNPHAGELMEIFSAARIDYGRIDYAFVAGRLQVFEINTNPAVLGSPPTPFDPYDQRPYAERHVAALLALPQAQTPSRQPEIDWRHERALRQLRATHRRARVRLTLQHALGRLRRRA